MKRELSDLRMSAVNLELKEIELPSEPIQFFDAWFNEAVIKSSHPQPNAMNLSTFGSNGFPQSRIVLLKEFNDEGFVFFTNYESQKGIAIEQNNKVSLNFYWPDMERSVRIEGLAQKTTEEQSDEYFNVRPLESRYYATASPQSRKLENREELLMAVEKLKKDLKGAAPERPHYWGGYLVKPVLIEFWQGRRFRFHDRIVYQLINDRWQMSRIAP